MRAVRRSRKIRSVFKIAERDTYDMEQADLKVARFAPGSANSAEIFSEGMQEIKYMLSIIFETE